MTTPPPSGPWLDAQDRGVPHRIAACRTEARHRKEIMEEESQKNENPENGALRIRAHHLLCTSLFSGHGYSDSFTMGLARIVERLQDGRDKKVILLDHPDGICAGCPKRCVLSETEDALACSRAAAGWDGKRGSVPVYGCREDHNHVVLTDEAVLKTLHLETGREYLYSHLLDQILTEVDDAAFRRICGGCRWYREGYCSSAALHRRVHEILECIRE